MKEVKEVKDSTPGGGFGVRHVITMILCSCLAVNYILRVNLSIAVVVMTDSHRNDSHPVFDWTPEQKGMLLSSFFSGYLISNMVAGIVVTKYSNKKILLWSVMYSTIISLLTPILVTWGDYMAMFIIRITMGLVQGFMMPVAHGLLSKWIPINERSRCASIVVGGMHLGTILSFLSSGLLSASPWGWPSVFYFSAVLTGLWSLIWMKYAADSPDTSTLISEAEKNLIKSTMSESVGTKNSKRVIPWRMIFTNKCVYAMIITMIGQNWGSRILMTQIPSYFSHVLHLDTTQNGALAALPYISLWVVSFPVAYLSDYLVAKKILNISTSRKVFNTVGQWGSAVALVCLAFTTSTIQAVTFYTMAVTMMAFTFVGYFLTPLDICPNYSGFLMGLANSISSVTSIGGPAFVGFVVKPLDNVEGWKFVFLMAAAMFFVGNIFFIAFASAKVQDFNNYGETKQNIHLEKMEKEPLSAVKDI